MRLNCVHAGIWATEILFIFIDIFLSENVRDYLVSYITL